MSGLVMLDGELLNLERLSAAQYGMMWSLYESHKGGSQRYPLQCHDHKSAMFLRNHRGQLWASHYPGSGVRCGKGISAPESPSHLHMKEYAYRAVDDAGFQAEFEFPTGNGTKLDVAVASPIPFGIEAQFSPIKPGLAKARTTKSVRAGWPPVWLPSTKQIGDSLAGLVPIIRHNDTDIDWESVVPRKGAATAVSLRHVIRERCTAGSRWNRCPSGSKNMCGRWHPWLNDPVIGLTLDDALAGIGAGQFTLLQNHLGYVYYVPASEVSIYQELTGTVGEYNPSRTPRRTKVRRGATPCAADLPVAQKQADITDGSLCQRCGRGLIHPISISTGICRTCQPLIFKYGKGWNRGDS